MRPAAAAAAAAAPGAAPPAKRSKPSAGVRFLVPTSARRALTAPANAAWADATRYHDPAARAAPAFELPKPRAEALLPAATGVRADAVTLAPHGSGTHAECWAHVAPSDADAERAKRDLRAAGAFAGEAAVDGPAELGVLVRVQAEALGASGEAYEGSVPAPEAAEPVVTAAALDAGWQRMQAQARARGGGGVPEEALGCVLVLVTAPGGFAFFTQDAMRWLVERGTRRLLVDQVSVDRLRCGPAMPAHRAFFFFAGEGGAAARSGSGERGVDPDPVPRPGALIVELVDAAALRGVDEGPVLVSLQLAPVLGTDAVPCRVLVLGLREAGEEPEPQEPEEEAGP